LVMQDEKRNAWRTVLFLCAIMLILCVADLIQQDIFFSESENRILAEKPELSVKNLLSGKYMEDYETYLNDQFVSRNTWITLKTGMDMLLQKKEINGVYLADDGYLIEQHLDSDFKEDTIAKKLDLLDKLVEQYPQIQVLLAPTADNILTEKLPFQAPYFDQRAFLSRVKDTIGEEHVIDVFPVLSEHAQEAIYYKTDHHWTTTGAYYAYLEWAKANDFEPMDYSLDTLQAVTGDFEGTLQSKLNMPVKGEEIHIFPQTLTSPVKLKYDMMLETESFYEEKYLTGKNKYGYFLDDNHGLIEITTDGPAKKQLFIIKDSYANTMIPLLAEHYGKIYVLDLRYFNGKLFPFMESMDEYGNMDVLVLYNCVHFIDDFRYF